MFIFGRCFVFLVFAPKFGPRSDLFVIPSGDISFGSHALFLLAWFLSKVKCLSFSGCTFLIMSCITFTLVFLSSGRSLGRDSCEKWSNEHLSWLEIYVALVIYFFCWCLFPIGLYSVPCWFGGRRMLRATCSERWYSRLPLEGSVQPWNPCSIVSILAPFSGIFGPSNIWPCGWHQPCWW